MPSEVGGKCVDVDGETWVVLGLGSRGWMDGMRWVYDGIGKNGIR